MTERNLTDDDIKALADEIISRDDVFRKLKTACTGRFVHGMKDAKKIQQEIAQEAKQMLIDSFNSNLEQRKAEVGLAVSQWFSDHFNKDIERKLESFGERILKEEFESMTRSVIFNKLRDKLGTVNLSFSIDDLFEKFDRY